VEAILWVAVAVGAVLGEADFSAAATPVPFRDKESCEVFAKDRRELFNASDVVIAVGVQCVPITLRLTPTGQGMVSKPPRDFTPDEKSGQKKGFL
jgi:hypothetical protein